MFQRQMMTYLVALLALQVIKQVHPAETVIKTALGGLPFNQFQDLNKPCDEGCLQYGNCNRELGECECPFGYSGPSCRTPLYPACRTSTRPDAPIFMGRTAPRNCHCYQQLLRAMCLLGDELRCASHTLALWDSLKCFELLNQGEEQQLSELPDRPDDPAVRWRKGVVVRDEASGKMRREFETLSRPPSPSDISYTVPLSKCPSRCNERGICQVADGLEQCTCFAGFAGGECAEVESPTMCANDCGGRGTCLGGFCKCEPPYWGVGCARSAAFEPIAASLYHPYYPSLKIYMYDVPPSIAGPHQFDDGLSEVFGMYQAFIRFIDIFLSDSGAGIRTENPYEANLFYIPTFAYYVTANLGDPTAAVVRAVDWVASKFPFFNRSAGKDHFVMLTSDRGACYLKPMRQTENLIRLVHFGMERPNITDLGPLVENKEYGCFKGGRDIVLPPYFKPKSHIRALHAQLEKPGGAAELVAKKDVLFFFSGDIRHHEPEYSGGVRQILSSLLANTSYPDVLFKGGYQPMAAGEYDKLLSRSKFCLAPYGHGWGIRLTHALMHACVPVVIQDKVRQPFEDLLHYPDFSLRLSKADLPRLVEILRAVPQEDVLRLTIENSRVYRAFIWPPELGGLAYNYTIASLRRRLSHLRGELYEAGTRRR